MQACKVHKQEGTIAAITLVSKGRSAHLPKHPYISGCTATKQFYCNGGLGVDSVDADKFKAVNHNNLEITSLLACLLF